ncbi:hypothetical protein KSE_32865 [Kitasatospora setae KM-6054]|uniref:Transposase DDE domain-containing protein n=1 Tax=Kitasatospora setae (strain ATCC 33774 / DSM 43861 / JCM 3304 / KCC A-0304 / NBRC 14216 / KM-6054) TaxID=452652 RepID=E4ND15_KITSK|nr:hypothetical protein KSE_32865 [Kitasatospora setae KM-6054]
MVIGTATGRTAPAERPASSGERAGARQAPRSPGSGSPPGTATSANYGPRAPTATTGCNLTLRPRPEHDILRRTRIEQATDHWRRRYGHRASVEGTVSQAVQAFELRRSRYRGLAKTQLQHHLTGAAINLTRLDAWLTGRPLARTRVSPFAALRPAG